jgi:hypothetical protein
VQLHEPPGEREPEPGALGLLAGSGLLELFEDPLELLGRYAGAGVGDGDLDPAVFGEGGEVDAASAGRELDRVREEVEDDLAYPSAVIVISSGSVSMASVSPAPLARSLSIETALLRISGIATEESSSSMRPASILARSRTSLISESRCLPASSTSLT